MKIVRKIEIDYGHTLPKHLGFCNQIHGHRGVIECVFEGEIVVDPKRASNGMVMDFAVCKQIMMEEIHEVLDHGFAIWKNQDMDHVLVTPNEVIKENNVPMRISTIDFIKARNNKVLVLDRPPTAEVLGAYFFEKIAERLEKRNTLTNEVVKLVELIWHETPNNKAVIKYEDILYDNQDED